MAEKSPTGPPIGDKLTALLETLLPGNDSWPGATDLELAATLLERIDMAAGHDDALQRILASLPDAFEEGTQSDREAALAPLSKSEDFGVVLLVAYDAYYVRDEVLALLEQRCGYVTRPPQPEGFVLSPFDESKLAQARQREPFWRKA